MLFFFISLASLTLVAAGAATGYFYQKYKAKKYKNSVLQITSIIDLSMDGIDFDCGVEQYQLN